jgi:uncharacterized damage-inducible protein DinB
MGANGDGRFNVVGDVVRHIFSAETRYIDRLAGRTLTDPKTIPTDKAAVFDFGRKSRKDLAAFVAAFPADRLDVAEEHPIMPPKSLWLSPRKIFVHIQLHEIRHWAQIATVLRMGGMKSDFHDFLMSPVLGDPRAGSAKRS